MFSVTEAEEQYRRNATVELNRLALQQAAMNNIFHDYHVACTAACTTASPVVFATRSFTNNDSKFELSDAGIELLKHEFAREIEELKARQENRLRDFVARVESKKRSDQAKKRAEELFAMFAPDAYSSFMKDGYVCIKGSNGGYYNLLMGGVVEGEARRNYSTSEGYVEYAWFCVKVPDVPAWDNILGLKLVIENDEEHFLSIANRFWVPASIRRCPFAGMTMEETREMLRDDKKKEQSMTMQSNFGIVPTPQNNLRSDQESPTITERADRFLYRHPVLTQTVIWLSGILTVVLVIANL